MSTGPVHAEGVSRLLHDLEQAATRRVELEQDTARAVALARAAGVTWEQIGAALGVTEQAVQRRYGLYGRPGRR